MKSENGKNKGFTIIELMIVIAIIGILVSIAFGGGEGEAEESKTGFNAQNTKSEQLETDPNF